VRFAVVVALVAILLAPSAAAPRGIPPGEVVYATWMVGGRVVREEWLERHTGATHWIESGGPACARHAITHHSWILYYSEDGEVVCDLRTRRRVRSAGDFYLLASSDVLRPRRMLSLRRARVVAAGPTVRVRMRWLDHVHYAVLDGATLLPLRFEIYEGERRIDEWRLRYRSVPRSSLPSDFFSPRR
jgi:hypothetical protein